MKLKDFLVAFDVHAPFYLRKMKGGTGEKYLILKDSMLNESENLRNCLNADVTKLYSSVNHVLGALVEVQVDV